MDLDLSQAPEQLNAGAMLIWAWALTLVPRLGAALVILAVGFLVAGWVSRLGGRIVARHLDATVEPIVGTTIRYAILILVLVAALGQLGVQTASLLAVLGAAGLAIGLALQGTLANIAAGIMLIYLRPFRVGDYIETTTIAGTVREIGLFATHLDTGEGLFFFAPNSEIWNKPLKNHSRNARRQMTIQIGITYDSDPAEARRVLLELASSDVRILSDPAPQVFVEKFGENAVTMAFQAWAPNTVFWEVQRATIEEARRRLEAAGVEIAFPQRMVQMAGSQPGNERRPGERGPGATR